MRYPSRLMSHLMGILLGSACAGFAVWPQSGRNLPTRAMDPAGEIRPGTTIKIENPRGSLRVEVWSENRLQWQAEARRGSLSSASWPVIVRRLSPEGVILVRPEPEGELDLRVKVPQQARLELKTTTGDVEISGEPEAVTVETTSGAIIVKLPATYDADLMLTTSAGAIQSELPVVVYGAFDAHTLRGRLGRGGPPLTARTHRGTISLRALPPPLDHPSRLVASGYIPSAPVAEARVSIPPILESPHRSDGPGESDASENRSPVSAPADRSPAGDNGAITLEAPLVNVNVSVTDALGRPLPDLKKEDFTVYEEGVPQTITHFASVEAPFDLLLLLDTSGSTENKLAVMKQAAQRFVDLIGPHDRMAVFTFTRRLRLVAPFTHQRLALKESIEAITGGGGTAFYDALWQTLDVLTARTNRRRAIIVMTDGVDNSIGWPQQYPSRTSYEELLRRVQESDVIIYPVYLDTEDEMVYRRRRESAESYAIARRQLAQLAEQTGGTLYRAATVYDLAGVYERVASELRTVYSLAYSPLDARHDGSWRTLRVTVHRSDVKVKSRRGYYAR